MDAAVEGVALARPRRTEPAGFVVKLENLGFESVALQIARG
jgi:hypothetical protein